MSEVIWIECKKCGRTFDYYYRGSGRKPEYCEKCKLDVIKQSKDIYTENKKKLKLQEIKNTTVIMDTVSQKAENQFMDYTTKVLDLLGQLDTLRVTMCNLLGELGQYQSNYDKQDQEFIHKIELNEFSTAEDALKFINEWHNDRKSRRNVKNLIKLLKDVVAVIPVKCKFTAINNISNIKLKDNNK